MIRNILSILPLALSVTTFNASAEKYDANIIDSNYKLKISKHSDYHKNLTVSDKILNNNIYRTHEELNSTFDALNSLKQDFEPEIRKLVESTGLHYRWFNFNVTGPIEIKLSGTSNGSTRIEISKFSLYGKAKAEKSWYLNVYASITMKNAYASGEIDLSTGKISNLSLDSDFDFDFDSTLDYVIPGLDFILSSDLADTLTEKIIVNAIKKYNGYQTMYSLDKVIPAHKYIYDGVDIGWQLQQQLMGMIDGQFIKVTMKNLTLSPTTRAYLCQEPGSMSWESDFAEVNVSNTGYLKMSRIDVQNCRWNGSSGQPDY